MSIEQIDSSNGIKVVGRPPHRGARGPVADASKVLGLGADEINQQLATDKSLSDIARTQGVDRGDLIAALREGMAPEMASSENVDVILDNIVDQKGPVGPPPGRPPRTPSSGLLGGEITGMQQQVVDQLSALLETDSASLIETLQSGTTLSDLLDEAGVATTDLAGILEAGIFYDNRI